MNNFEQGIKHYENKEDKEAIPFFEKINDANTLDYLGFTYLALYNENE